MENQKKCKASAVFKDNSILEITDITDMRMYDTFLHIVCADSKIVISPTNLKYIEFEEQKE